MTTSPSAGSVVRERVIIVLIVMVLLAADQWTKALARADLNLFPKHYHALGVSLSLLYAENEGAFLSFGASMPAPLRAVIFTGAVSVAVLMALVVLLMGRIHGADAYAVGLIAGGGLGNLIDRVLREGRVTDFIYLSAGPVHTGVFNVADMAITGAVIWLFVTSFRKKPEASEDGVKTEE